MCGPVSPCIYMYSPYSVHFTYMSESNEPNTFADTFFEYCFFAPAHPSSYSAALSFRIFAASLIHSQIIIFQSFCHHKSILIHQKIRAYIRFAYRTAIARSICCRVGACAELFPLYMYIMYWDWLYCGRSHYTVLSKFRRSATTKKISNKMSGCFLVNAVFLNACTGCTGYGKSYGKSS